MKLELVAGLELELDPLELLPCIWINVPKKVKANEILKQINALYPLDSSLGHVKRIWRRTNDEGFDLLLLLSHKKDELTLWSERLEGMEDYLRDVKPSVSELMVPNRMPMNRTEYEKWRIMGYWPTSFHENVTEIKRLREEFISVFRTGHEKAFEMLKRGEAEVVIVDPQKPFQLVTFVKGSDKDVFVPNGHLQFMKNDPVLKAISKVSQMQQQKINENNYLLTGLFVYLKREPNTMETMALLHSRVKSIIFIEEDLENGAICSKLRLQSVKGLNHYFTVYRYHHGL